MTLMTITPFCAQADIERLLSPYGVEAFSDHNRAGTYDADVVDDCIAQASEELAMHLTQRYTVEGLATSPLVARWATVVAAYFLCGRRGNPIPDSIAAEFARIMDLDGGLAAQVSSGRLQIPGLPLRCDMRPSWSNLQVDRRFIRNKTRVTKSNSSDSPTKLTQDGDVRFPAYGGR